METCRMPISQSKVQMKCQPQLFAPAMAENRHIHRPRNGIPEESK